MLLYLLTTPPSGSCVTFYIFHPLIYDTRWRINCCYHFSPPPPPGPPYRFHKSLCLVVGCTARPEENGNSISSLLVSVYIFIFSNSRWKRLQEGRYIFRPRFGNQRESSSSSFYMHPEKRKYFSWKIILNSVLIKIFLH